MNRVQRWIGLFIERSFTSRTGLSLRKWSEVKKKGKAMREIQWGERKEGWKVSARNVCTFEYLIEICE